MADNGVYEQKQPICQKTQYRKSRFISLSSEAAKGLGLTWSEILRRLAAAQNDTAKASFAPLPKDTLIQFRQVAYSLQDNAKDALFELADAVMATPAANSFVELSCSRFFRRRWPSAYEALQNGQPDRSGLMALYIRHTCSLFHSRC